MSYDWKDTIRQKMSGYTENEPDGLLQDIMKELDTIPAIGKPAARNGKSSVKASVLRFTGAFTAAAASIALIATLWNNTPDSSEINEIAVIKNNSERQIAELIDIQKHPAEVENPAIIRPDTRNKLFSESAKDEYIKACDITENHATTDGDTAPEAYSNQPDVNGQNTSPKNQYDKDHESYNLDNIWNNDFPDEEIKRKKRNFSTDIFYSNLSGSNTAIAGFSTMRQLGATPFSGIPARESVSAKPGEGIMLITSGENSNTTVKHRQPVRAGVTVRYNFTKCWGIETGIVYSYLSSRMETTESQYKSTTEQKLHYIGIPVRASWSFLNREHVSLYLSAGGMLEKCIAGNATTDYILNGNSISSNKDNISIKPLQWSVNASAGVQWNITGNIGIYAEPGISYHFDDRSNISTAYKEKPLNFNIEIGLRFSFE